MAKKKKRARPKRPENAMLAKRDAAIYAGYRQQLDVALQMGLDAAIIAANKVLQLGKGRAPEFGKEYMEAINAIAKQIVNDSKDDKDCVYSREKLDQTIKAIVGEENFAPWEERYCTNNIFRHRKGN